MSRWILVSNRLPFNANLRAQKVERGSGGLVTALMGLESTAAKIWVGSLNNPAEAELIKSEAKNLGFEALLPVLIEKPLYDAYYDGFANDVLWPLFHYQGSMLHFKKENWDAYTKVNEAFADAILKEACDDDMVWIHDFHLCLLPRLIKNKRPSLKVGFFLHIPWPSSEIFRQLPVREEILNGILGADLVGFHDSAYVRHFASSVQGLLGHGSDLHHIHAEREIGLGVFPVGIDPEYHRSISRSDKVQNLVWDYESSSNALQILGIDRLDYSKGLETKLEIFRQFLRTNPQWVGHVQLTQVAIPTRQGVPEYRRLKKRIDQLVGEINGEFSKPGYSPVNYLFSSVDSNQLSALYRHAKVLLVTSHRDGMNLVAMEYLASQNNEDPGVLVLSEFTGASSLLGDALPVNPWNIEESAQTLKTALEMPLKERLHRHQQMMPVLESFTSAHWGDSFMEALTKTQNSLASRTRLLEPDAQGRWSFSDEVLEELRSRPLVIVSDYDGTLVPIEAVPEQALISNRTKAALSKLQNCASIDVHVVSGRDRDFLDSQIGSLQIHRAAEHGAETCSAGNEVWTCPLPVTGTSWYIMATEIMADVSRRVYGSFVEQKSRGVVWHYRQAPGSFAEYQARKLLLDLSQGLSNFPVSVSRGKKIIEVRSLDANKGSFLTQLRSRYSDPTTLFIVIGDDRTDEDMFEALGAPSALSIKVGSGQTRAAWRLSTQKNVVPLLEWIASIRNLSLKPLIGDRSQALQTNARSELDKQSQPSAL